SGCGASRGGRDWDEKLATSTKNVMRLSTRSIMAVMFSSALGNTTFFMAALHGCGRPGPVHDAATQAPASTGLGVAGEAEDDGFFAPLVAGRNWPISRW